MAALDIGIASPYATGAGPDCCEAGYQRKLHDYRQFLDELTSEGIRYVPMLFSCFGRAHPEAMRVVVSLAASVARRRGIADTSPIVRKCLAWIGVRVQRRAAAMVRACMPSCWFEDLLCGGVDGLRSAKK